MKTTIRILGILLFFAGLIWFLQGVNILPGSYMTGNPQWSINGGVAMAVGAGMYVLAKRNG